MTHITIKDVAKKAGVSIATVSRAMQDKGIISPSTKMRVLDVAKELNYRIDMGARSLKKKQTKSIGRSFHKIQFYQNVVLPSDAYSNTSR